MDRLHDWALAHADKTAVMMSEGAPFLTYGQLDARASRIACWLVSLRLQEGDTIGLSLDNELAVVELWWGARRAGLYYTPIPGYLTPAEAAYILQDAGARLLVTNAARLEDAAKACTLLPPGETPLRFAIGAEGAGFKDLNAALSSTPDSDLPERAVGREMIYSSGTTGRPKGIRRPLSPAGASQTLPALELAIRSFFKVEPEMVYLSASPLHHATGRFLMRTLESGGTCVIMPKFEPEAALAAIERHRITHTLWVPTMFQRMLALPDEVRFRTDVSSLKLALHGAAPCQASVKRRMIDWWGPIVDEFYGGSENVGLTFIDAATWLQRPGSVGKAIGSNIHILSEDGTDTELPPGQIGRIHFSGGLSFTYLNDEKKTAGAFSRQGWGAYGDIGRLDEDGFLFLSDRRTDLIISGGVNIYPKEIELALEDHPAVLEAAVIGVPDEAFGQAVKALVRLENKTAGSPYLAAELISHCRGRIAGIKCPKTVEFVDDFPRNETGKLLKRTLREQHAAS